ncbi:extracellular solute-binding protein [Paenibacillus humicola]|uniref:extracellular solute-binding protein n=1 Tax=Paenibacillus humicola TaxID=3110540 RepID=UPI00237B42A5|nr:extracellular solute-binding protein [Paenibacillus humicola]
MKKGFLTVLAAALIVSVSACSGNGGDEQAKGPDRESPGTEASGSGKTGEDAPGQTIDPFGKYDQLVTMSTGQCIDPTAQDTLGPGETPSDNVYTRAIEQEMNIKTTSYWTVACTNLDQKVSLAIASNDLPDAMKVNKVQLREMVESGQLEEMTEAVKYASPFIQEAWKTTNGEAMASATFDGKLMAIPGVGSSDGALHNLWIRKDWLDKLGLELPKTLDDLEKVAKAFVEQDPDGNGKADTIGIMGTDANDPLYPTFLEGTEKGLGSIFYAKNAYPGYWVKGSDGSAVYGSIQPETKEALSVLRKWYAEGLIDPQVGVRKDDNEPIVAGKAGIFFQALWAAYTPLTDAWKNDPKANWQSYALPLDANGKWNQTVNAPTVEWLVAKKGFKHPEAVMKLANYRMAKGDHFEEDLGVEGSNMPLRTSFDRRDQMTAIAKLIKGVFEEGQPKETLDVDFEPALYPDDYNKYVQVKKKPYDNYDIQNWNLEDMAGFTRMYVRVVGSRPLMDPNRNDVESLIWEQTPTMTKRWANLMKLESETFYKIILGSAPLDSFDQFVESWKRQGGDQITKEVQDFLKQ